MHCSYGHVLHLGNSISDFRPKTFQNKFGIVTNIECNKNLLNIFFHKLL